MFKIKLSFGKHKGLTLPEIAQIDRKYLHWLVGPFGHGAIMKYQENWEILYEETDKAYREFGMHLE